MKTIKRQSISTPFYKPTVGDSFYASFVCWEQVTDKETGESQEIPVFARYDHEPEQDENKNLVTGFSEGKFGQYAFSKAVESTSGRIGTGVFKDCTLNDVVFYFQVDELKKHGQKQIWHIDAEIAGILEAPTEAPTEAPEPPTEEPTEAPTEEPTEEKKTV